ncbi:MAG TPA: hypothetical protein VFY93_14585 [Planctomycetota bacterium]|nr:hypothetical protein [Planctomycetota bacterium]
MLLLPAPLLLLAAVAAAAPEVRENDRFRLEAEAPKEEADELFLLLDQAYAQLAARFKAKAGKLSVVLSEGAPGAATDGKTVAVQRQPGRYATRAALLREFVRVFYEVARAKGRAAETPWCREGQYDFLAGHDWDGKTLKMGVVPAVSAENLMGKALAETRQAGFALGPLVDGSQPMSRALGCAVFGHVATGNGGKPIAGFDKFDPKMAGGVKAAPLFWQCFGKEPEYTAAFTKWLETAQQPFVPIAGDWEGLSPGRLRGGGKGLSACRFQLPAGEFKVKVGAPPEKKGWKAGVVLSYASDDEYAVFLADWAGYFHIFKMVGGKRQILEQGEGAPPSADGYYRIQLFRKKDQVYLMLEGGASYGPWELPGSGFGLAVENNDLVFNDVSWK